MRAALLLAAALLLPAPDVSPSVRRAKAFADAVRAVNERHAEKPGKAKEDDLAALLPKEARKALDSLLAEKDSPDLAPALLVAAGGALDLDLEEEFGRIRERLEKAAPAEAAKAGFLVSRPRFLALGRDGVTREYLEDFAGIVEGILGGYDEVFGFEEWSKVPGKKLRFLVHQVPRITRPPHFAPEFEFHSQVDFPVPPEERITSPTPQGQFLFYGLCHELGHVIAMMDRGSVKVDHHQWAHYTGVAVVEHLAGRKPEPPWLDRMRDARWRSLTKERERLKDAKPGLDGEDGVLKTLVSLHDTVGPRAIGEAINRLDREDERERVNRVRYYDFKGIRKALLEVVKEPAKRKAVEEILKI
ncbi:MAG: hypothetical protein HUU06_08990 [Planctomycetaceae bacterium]|nr:hypothetical protein [Planctomycetota bacterium]NUN52903.1 hypothetical protein [Planctomycetaceae bacterium]